MASGGIKPYQFESKKDSSNTDESENDFLIIVTDRADKKNPDVNVHTEVKLIPMESVFVVWK